jgi:hypothetical protein
MQSGLESDVQRDTKERAERAVHKELSGCLVETSTVFSRSNKRQRPKVETAKAEASGRRRSLQQRQPSKQQQHQQEQPESSQSSTTISSSTTFRQPPLQIPCTTVRLLGYPRQHPDLRLFTLDATSVPPRASSLHAPPRPLRLPPLVAPSASLSNRMLE